MNAMILEGVAPAAIVPGLFTQKNQNGSKSAAASSKAFNSVPAWWQPFMKVRLSLVAAVVVCLSFTCRPASAQEVIHALTGTLTSVSATGKSVSTKLDDGSMRTLNLKEISGSHAASSVEKALQARAIPAGGLGKSGERVILFYYGVAIYVQRSHTKMLEPHLQTRYLESSRSLSASNTCSRHRLCFTREADFPPGADCCRYSGRGHQQLRLMLAPSGPKLVEPFP